MSIFNVTFVARMPPPGVNSIEGRLPFALPGRIDATSNRSDCIPVSRPEAKTTNPSNNALAVQLTKALEIEAVITDSPPASVPQNGRAVKPSLSQLTSARLGLLEPQVAAHLEITRAGYGVADYGESV